MTRFGITQSPKLPEAPSTRPLLTKLLQNSDSMVQLATPLEPLTSMAQHTAQPLASVAM
jgi:hypothetical protein